MKKKLKNYFKNSVFLYLILSALASIIALISAYISEFIFGYQPCILCYYQRKPFFAIIVIVALVLCKKKYQKIGAVFCAILFLVNAGIAFYHSGVEQKFFRGPTTCSSQNLNNITDFKEFEMAILSTKAVRCDEPQFYFLNLTMANWNFIYSLFLFFLVIIIFTKKLQKKINSL
ncbi:MAG: disulfide bond formation protein B [Alphaproteobacteria bacterium]